METERITASDFTLMLEKFPKVYLNKTNADILSSLNKVFKQYQEQVKSVYSYEVVKVNVARPLYNDESENKKRREQLLDEKR